MNLAGDEMRTQVWKLDGSTWYEGKMAGGDMADEAGTRWGSRSWPNRPDLLSPAPVVRLENTFREPFDNAIATARTCYSAKVITAEDVVEGRARRSRCATRSRSEAYEAGHHTTLQHAHFQFALENVSRQFLWSFLHAPPVLQLEQVSQRYVEVKPGNFVVPPLPPKAEALYRAAMDLQMRPTTS